MFTLFLNELVMEEWRKIKDVLNMRQDYKKGMSYKKISKKYNRPYSTVYNIINKYYWKDI